MADGYFLMNFLTVPRKSASYKLPSVSIVTPSAKVEQRRTATGTGRHILTPYPDDTIPDA
jgi:hypothetical protein